MLILADMNKCRKTAFPEAEYSAGSNYKWSWGVPLCFTIGVLLPGDVTADCGIILTGPTELKAKCWCCNLFIKVNFFL